MEPRSSETCDEFELRFGRQVAAACGAVLRSELPAHAVDRTIFPGAWACGVIALAPEKVVRVVGRIVHAAARVDVREARRAELADRHLVGVEKERRDDDEMFSGSARAVRRDPRVAHEERATCNAHRVRGGGVAVAVTYRSARP